MITVTQAKLPEVPAFWGGSKPEYYVYLALGQLGIEFDYQSAYMGGRLAKGGVVLDFYIADLNLGLNIVSRYYHYETAQQRYIDELQRLTLEGMGVRVIFLEEEDILRNPFWLVREALAGRDHSRAAQL